MSRLPLAARGRGKPAQVGWTGLLSLLAHGAAIAAMLGWIGVPAATPTEEAVVELVAGHSMDPAGGESGQPTQGNAPPAPAPAPPLVPDPPPLAKADDGSPHPPPTPPLAPRPPTPSAPSVQAATAPAGRPDIRLGRAAEDVGVEIAAGGRNVAAVSETGNINPDYPIEAARRHEAGLVRLRLWIDADGNVTEVDIVASSGSRILDTAAAARLKTWHYRPATRNGRAVASVVDQNVDFGIDQE